MINKIFTGIIAFILLFTSISTYAADAVFTVEDNKGTLEVSQETILAGTAEKNTSIIDLFKFLNIDGKTISDNIIDVLDVRYVTPDKVDYKVNSDTDIIDANSQVYILFKSIDDGGLVGKNSTINFELKNFKMNEIGTVSNIEENAYNKVYDVEYIKAEAKDPVVEDEQVIEEKVIDNNILTENNTGIKDNILLILIGLFTIGALLMFPKNKLNNF